LLVAAGGALGASSRFWVREILPVITGSDYPFSTLLVNVVGCFLAGFVYISMQQNGSMWTSGKALFFMVGFLGAFTTFSAFSLEAFIMFEKADYITAVTFILLSVVLSISGLMLGVNFIRLVF
jgi:CrcB protein